MFDGVRIVTSPPGVMPWLEIVIGCTLAVFVLHTWLDFRQLRVRSLAAFIFARQLHRVEHSCHHQALRIPKPPKYVAKQVTT